AVYGSGVQVEPAAVVVDACGAEQPGALDEAVEQLGGERVDLRGGPGRAEELARDAPPPFLPGEQRGVLERDAAAGSGGGAGDESAASGLERAVVCGGGCGADPGVDRGEGAIACGLERGEVPLAGGQRV